MKSIIKYTAILFILSSCSSDINNDRLGLFVKTSGLRPTSVIAYQNQKLKSDKNIEFGQELTIEILGVNDFVTDKVGKVFPGGENSLVDENENVLYYVEDYFKKYEFTGVNISDAENLKFNLRIGKPMEKGKKYFFLFKLWDKKSKKELKGNIELNVI